MAPRLGVNVDHVATVRQARGTRYPDPVTAAALAEIGGADQITVHLREDRRHIQDRDLRLLRETVQTRLNLEMAATDAMLDVAREIRPDSVTLVPERREEQTTEGGLHVAGREEELGGFCARLAEEDLVVSLFVDPDPTQIEAAQRLEVDVVELHTGDYADADDDDTRERELDRLERTAEQAHAASIVVAAGHGLDYVNVKDVASLHPVEELNIGHSIVARALFEGFQDAVERMVALLGET